MTSTPGRCIVVGYDGSAAAEAALRLAAERPRPPSWESQLLAGPPAAAIVGSRESGRVRALRGSVAHQVLHRAECPVTIIPEQVASRMEPTGAQPIAAP